MNSSRVVLRSTRAVRVQYLRQGRHIRFQSTSQAPEAGHSHARTALYGGLAGGVFAVVLGYGWYSFSGAKSAVNIAHQTKAYFDSSKKKLQDNAPEPNEALEWLRKQTSFYAGFVPGGKQYVDSAFKDLDTVRDKHGDEVDKIVKNAYEELKGVAGNDLSVSTATEAWGILQKYLKQITDLASDAAHEILGNHPELQSKIGTNVDQLRSLGQSFGPEANKVVQDTWSQMKDIVIGGGMSAASIQKLQKLLKEKTDQVKKLGEKAWDKGQEEIKPYLDKNPKIKELIESNKKDLLSGDFSQLWTKAKDAAQSGKTDDLEKFVKDTVEKAKQKSGSFGNDISDKFEQYAKQFLPAGSEQLLPKFQQFKELAQNGDTEEMEKLAKSTVAELKEVLEKKLSEGKKIVDKASKE